MVLQRLLVSASLAALMAGGGYAKKSLSASGAALAFLVGLITFFVSSVCGTALICFFVTSSIVTRLGGKRKRVLEGELFREGGRRTWVQVLSNAPATLLCVAMLRYGHSYALVSGYVAQIAAMQGDTWSSEIGVLGRQAPRLITTFARVPAGTNGGVTLLGFAGAALGGLVLGLAVWASAALSHLGGAPLVSTIAAVVAYALVGSVVDSVLGATLQFSGLDKRTNTVVEHPGPTVQRICGQPLLDNHQINLVSALIVMLIGISFPLF